MRRSWFCIAGYVAWGDEYCPPSVLYVKKIEEIECRTAIASVRIAANMRRLVHYIIGDANHLRVARSY